MGPKWLIVVGLCMGLGGCREESAAPHPTSSASAPASGPSPSATASTRYPEGAWHAVRAIEEKGRAQQGVVPVTRILLASLTTDDAIGFAIRFEGVNGAFAKEDAAGTRRMDWSASLAKTQFVVSADGKKEVLELASAPTPTDVSPLGQRARVIKLSHKGVHQFSTVTPWRTASTLLGTTGEVSVELRGELVLEGETVPYVSKPMQFTVTAPSADTQPLAHLEGMASRLIVKTERLKKGPPASRGHVIDDDQGNRLFRFYLTELDVGYQNEIADVAMSPKGAILAVRRFSSFSCVAAGALIQTPRGEVGIEALSVGDAIWGYDIPRQQRVRTRVEAVAEGVATELFTLGALRVTGIHPVFANGGWVASSQLKATDVVVGADLERRPAGLIQKLVMPPGEAARVFDLTVAWPHNFFASGILVHNKAAPVPEGAPGDPWQGLFTRGKQVAAP